MIDSYINEQFVYYMRQKDPTRHFWVIRSDKLLSTSTMYSSNELEEHAKSEEDIKAILAEYGIKFLVVEKNDIMKIPIHQTLRHYLASEDFRLVKEITTHSNQDSRYRGDQTIQIFENLKWVTPKAKSITIRVPTVGKVFTVPLNANTLPR